MATFRTVGKFQLFQQGMRCEEDGDDRLADWQLPLCFTERRHLEKITAPQDLAQGWRMKERMKTVSVALVLCLNVGVDPPDVVKPSPCARTETWIDPLSMSPQKALEAVGNNLQKQYERWQPKARYKLSLDPTTDDVKKLCTSLRRNAKEERVLFHYNGHAVPKPTTNGEIWVFNKSYTQYIPLSLYDLQTWMGSPSIYVWDCNTAGVILDSFDQFARQRRDDHLSRLQMQGAYIPGSSPTPPDPPAVKNYIQLSACGPQELLPMNCDLPADLFTSCLTTPIKTALRLYVMQKTNRLRPGVTVDVVDKIPGRLNDRRTPLGELNWIFTAITDTIAWNTLPRDVFQQLFRQDLLVASLFRNFLLADRIMRTYNCTPMSTPSLPNTHQHPLWQAWDLSLDLCLPQIPSLLEGKTPYQSSPFFSEQLTAFQVWLALGCDGRQPPEQLPVVLQVLLSQVHRVRALELLGRFLDLGPWAVNEALSVGIFPYVLKLLQSTARELRHLLVFIWAKILAVDSSCQSDLVKDGTHRYFLTVLCDPYMLVEHRTNAAFVLSQIVCSFSQGQEVCLQGHLIATCLEQLLEPHPLLRRWLAICLGQIWRNFEDAKWVGVRDSAHEKLFYLLTDSSPEVRTAAVFALGTFIGVSGERNDHVNNIDNTVASRLLNTVSDGSPLVREELAVALHGFVTQFEMTFMSVAAHMQEDERQKDENVRNLHGISTSFNPVGDWVMVHTDYTASNTSHSDPTSAIQPTELASSPSQKPNVVRATSAGELQAVNETRPVMHSSSATSVPTKNKTSNSVSVGDGFSPVATSPPMQASGSSLGSSNSSPTTYGDFLRRSPNFGFNSVYISTWKTLSVLCLDPCPSVSVPARSIVSHISSRALNVAQPRRCRSSTTGSHSAPSSPTMQRRVVTESVAESSVAPDSVQVAASEPMLHQPNSPKKISLPAKSLTVPYSQQFATKRKIFGRGPSRNAESLAMPSSSSTSSFDDSTAQQQQPQGASFLKTGYCEWSASHFTRRVSKVPEIQDRQSDEYQERQERYIRNSQLRKGAELEQRRAEKCRLDDQVLVHRNPHNPACLRFHPYSSELMVGERSGVSIWDWEQGSKVCTLTVGQSREGRITAMDYVNAHDDTLLLTGSDDGAVRLWRNYTSETREVFTAWKALSDMLPSTKGSGLVLQWEQQSGLLFASGDVKHILVWDSEKEMKVQEIATGADSCVTSLATDEAGRSLLVAGCGDGSVRLFDRRSPSGECVFSSHVMTLKEHKSWIVKVFVQTGRDGKIVSGSIDGQVKQWDPRFSESVKTTPTSPMMSALDVHPKANIFASGSPQQFIKVYNLSGQSLSTIRYHDGFMGQRIGPISCLAFHPYKAFLAAGSTDSYLSIYTLEKQKK